jgi:hypothetical protein
MEWTDCPNILGPCYKSGNWTVDRRTRAKLWRVWYLGGFMARFASLGDAKNYAENARLLLGK